MKSALTNGAICHQLLCIAVLTVLVTRGATCFIRNCPMGGKRSGDSQGPVGEIAQRQCIRCGPQGLGHCIGPNICCGESVGCFINTEESAICRREDELETPCRVSGAPCGPDSDGHCVSRGVCCTDETCRLDSSCQQTASMSSPRMRTSALRYLQTLMDPRPRRAYPSLHR